MKYRYGLEEEGQKRYDVMIVDEGYGGSLLLKGAPAIIDKKKIGPWSSFGIELTDATTIRFKSAINDRQHFFAEGKSKIPPEEWVHVGVAQSADKVQIYINGELDIEKDMDVSLLHLTPSKLTQVEIESPHPYLPNTDNYTTVEYPGAVSYKVRRLAFKVFYNELGVYVSRFDCLS